MRLGTMVKGVWIQKWELSGDQRLSVFRAYSVSVC